MTVTVAQGTTLIRIDHASAVYTAVRAAREVAAKAGLPEVLAERAAVIASELAGNIDKHASDGSVFVQQSLAGHGIDIYATDAGPGMANLDYWRIDGHSTTETLGTGLGAVGRLATEFRIRSAPGAGTIAAARVLAPGRPAAGIAHVRLPHEGEERCGDALALSTVRGVRTIAIVDGLGHGPEAGDAAEAAIEVFGQRPGRSLSEQLTAMHRRLRQTRGAAVALARVSGDLLEFCGVGNISGLVLTPGRSQPLLSTPGVVGFSLPSTHVRSLALAGPHVIVLHTDGIGTGWRGPAPLGPLPEPSLLTADLAQHHRDPRDDATVIAFGPGGDTT
ncbi:ATP-binding protein [Amycolatopsis regifaucium]|uniref:Anti-sigma regulatory factor n=1 Tax=Amycolatopsis regifaucium TaxID=546365 RepID=A0A154MPM7_9PSEU|nr:ATP-binding protein [Amycolatopsis regifaucium]KZB85389.1 anti-sigma regulatory factor [Amycolatopsis regifaucium]OKA09003.1 anti-sigma regulatory factor [Amycolatopsis regifaucium]SFJ38653.1 Anti-sigma regulatory factor (Ser/Thr protein kinase) [Amycolatopsis regifaucium]